ncbi:MAG: CapA family protein, partial [Planctomycetota bacterium]
MFSDDQNDFTLVATGDSLIFQKISIFQEKNFLAVKSLVEKGDARFANFETITPKGKGFPRYKRDPTTWMTSPRFVVDELVWMGFNLFSLANNHSMDYSEGGLLETLNVFDSEGLTNAGTGKTLSEAREPAYLNTKKGKVALIAINTGDTDGPAGDPWMSVNGRPGLNPLRYITTIQLEEKYFQQMCVIAEKLDLSRGKDGRLKFLECNIIKSDINDVITS